jgi:hypothetical protein
LQVACRATGELIFLQNQAITLRQNFHEKFDQKRLCKLHVSVSRELQTALFVEL